MVQVKQYFIKAILTLVVVLAHGFLLAQDPTHPTRFDAPADPDAGQPLGYKVPKPVFGMGIGMFSYFGNLAPKNYFQNPGVSRYAVTLSLSEKLNENFYLNLYGMTGTLGVAVDANTSRNANFQSQINLGGATITYNFGHFIPISAQVRPFISTGFEGFTFNSKTDLYDRNGNRYYYWKDGTIRNIAQNSPDSAQAKMLNRDYTYETDIRLNNAYGKGMYPNSSYAIPVGAGTIFKLSDRVELNIHCVMHFTFTNYIDGLGNYAGSKRKDNFLETGFALHWDLLGPKKKKEDTLSPDYYQKVNFDDLMAEDSDGDGVKDSADWCPCTAKGATVDKHGCTQDTDGDGVPDYLDKEPDTKPYTAVDEFGVTLSDSIIALKHNQFYDTTNAFAEVEHYVHGEYDRSSGRVILRDHHISPKGMFVPDDYTILLGKYDKGVPTTAMTQFLSIRDIETTTAADSSMAFTAGHYKTFEDAKARRDYFKNNGNPQAKIVYKKNGEFIATEEPVLPPNANQTANAINTKNGGEGEKIGSGDKTASNKNKGGKGGVSEKGSKGIATDKREKSTNGQARRTGNNEGIDKDDSLLVANTKGVVFRVQLGAYGHRLSKSVFKSIPDLIEIKTEDNLYKYMTGNYSNFKDAAKAKIEMAEKGYVGTFINAYKDGKHVTLGSVGATPSEAGKADNSLNKLPENDKKSNVFDKSELVFKVQLGIFKKDLNPTERDKFKHLEDKIEIENTNNGLTRYTVGSSNNYDEIVKLKNKMKSKGFEDAFILSYYKGQLISIQEAIEMSK